MEESIIFICIAIFIVVVISFIIIASNDYENREYINQQSSNKRSLNCKEDNFNGRFSPEKAGIDALEEFETLNDKQIFEYAEMKKKSLIEYSVIVSLILVLLSAVCLIFYFKVKASFTLPLSIILFVAALIVIGVMFIILKTPTKDLAAKQLKTEFKKIYKKIDIFYNDYYSQVIAISPLNKKLKDLNNSYNFDKYKFGKHQYYYELNSKRALDNYNYDKSFLTIINDEYDYFYSLCEKYAKIKDLYWQYDKEYGELKQFTTRELFKTFGCNLKYSIFNYIEQDIYNKSKKKNVEEPFIKIFIEYTSPSGRNYYSDKKSFTYKEIIIALGTIQENEKYKLINQREKERQQKLKREKERKLREIDKRERELIQREQELYEKETIFKKATKGHIYSADAKPEVERLIITKEKTQYQKLKELRQQFENGEITKEEFEFERKKLI